MSLTPEEQEAWKNEIYTQTQGNVDVDRDYPNLGRYLGPNFFADKNWWDEASKIFTHKEKEELGRWYVNHFAPEVILFADKTSKSREYFELLMDNDISLRVLPVDEHITEPSVGFIAYDMVFPDESSLGIFIESRKNMLDTITTNAKEFGFQAKPDPQFKILMDKVRQVQIDRAIVEMARIQRGGFQEDVASIEEVI